jgi:PAS domain S-box-containing protein
MLFPFDVNKDELCVSSTALKSSPSPLAAVILFAIIFLATSLAAMYFAAHYFWWTVLLLVISSTLISAFLHRCFHFFAGHKVQQLRIQSLHDQLLQAEDRLQKTKDLHSPLLHHAGQGVFGVAEDGRLIFTNPAAENILGFSHAEMAGIKLHPLIHHHHRNGEDYLEEECPLYKTLTDGITRQITDELFWCADGTSIDVDYVVAALKDGDRIIGAVVMFNDTTMARKQQALLKQRERSLAQAQELAQLGSWRFDVQEQNLECSDECYRIFGLPIGSPIKIAYLLRIIDPEDRATVSRRWRTQLEDNISDIQYRIHVGGNVKWVHERSEVQLVDDGKRCCFGAVLDISEAKRKEAQLRRSKQRLRELVAHREQVREAERAHIAREVHDELGQQLTALRMDTTMLKLRYAEPSSEFEEHIQRMKYAIDSCIVSVREVASSLRPAALDMGLIASVDWLLKKFGERTAIATEFIAPTEDLLLDDERATTVFRVLQESLTNITRHAQASRVEVCLRREANILHISVADNGKGFDTKVVRDKPGFGLMGMRERVLAFGGHARFDTIIGQGTTVRLAIPLP